MTPEPWHHIKKLVGAAVATLFLVSGAMCVLLADAAAGSLLVESEPNGASVYVDGRPAGNTPLTLPSIAAGTHRVRVVRLGYLENSRLVTVKPGMQASLRMRLTEPAPQTANAAALKIVVVEGEGAVNIIQQKTAVAPVIEVRDRNDQPVSGAVVRFAIQKGRASFNGVRTLSVTTNAAGRATATGLTVSGKGALQIAATAAFQGQTAAATIAQTTVVTAAEASSVASGTGTASASGGGMSHGAIAGIAGGAGAGVAGAVLASRGSSVLTPSIGVSPSGSGIQDVTVFTFSVSGGSSSPFAWDFGDGTTGTGDSVTHTFHATGQFQVSVRGKGSDAAGSLIVPVGNLTGSWLYQGGDGLAQRLIITQQGSNLSGLYNSEGPVGVAYSSVPLTGTVSSPRSVTIRQGGECLRTITNGIVSADVTTISGVPAAGNPSPGCLPGGQSVYTRVGS